MKPGLSTARLCFRDRRQFSGRMCGVGRLVDRQRRLDAITRAGDDGSVDP